MAISAVSANIRHEGLNAPKRTSNGEVSSAQKKLADRGGNIADRVTLSEEAQRQQQKQRTEARQDARTGEDIKQAAHVGRKSRPEND